MCVKNPSNKSRIFLLQGFQKFIRNMFYHLQTQNSSKLEWFLESLKHSKTCRFSKFSTLLPKEPSFPLAHLPCFRWVPRPNQKNTVNQIWHLAEALFLFSVGTSATQRTKESPT